MNISTPSYLIFFSCEQTMCYISGSYCRTTRIATIASSGRRGRRRSVGPRLSRDHVAGREAFVPLCLCNPLLLQDWPSSICFAIRHPPQFMLILDVSLSPPLTLISLSPQRQGIQSVPIRYIPISYKVVIEKSHGFHIFFGDEIVLRPLFLSVSCFYSLSSFAILLAFFLRHTFASAISASFPASHFRVCLCSSFPPGHPYLSSPSHPSRLWISYSLPPCFSFSFFSSSLFATALLELFLCLAVSVFHSHHLHNPPK